MKRAIDVRAIMDTLEGQHPDADTALLHRNAFELLIATILSAQSTDARVNLVTPALFARYPDAAALANAAPEELDVPADMDALTALPGVGRKTANVVLGHALGVPGLPVDRHVLRVANRIGIAESDDPEVVEQQLCKALPKARWTRTSDTLILHGRRICRPKPLCDQCDVRDDCDYYPTIETSARDLKRPSATSRQKSGRQRGTRGVRSPRR